MSRIYVADDDPNIVEAMTMVLEANNHEVAHQYDSKNIVENVKRFAPDVIILDVMFPENDAAGFEMARELRQDDAVNRIPVIMLSAVNDKGSYPGTFSNRDRDDSFLPVNEFVEKPISPDDLIAKIAELTSGRGPAARK